MYFKDKVEYWYRSLPNASITSWDDLVEVFINEFDEVYDPISFLMQFTSIKKNNQEYITKFNNHSNKSWARVSFYLRPKDSKAYMYYLKVFSPKLNH